MAKKVIATLRKSEIKGYTKVIKMVRSSKTGAYKFKEEIVPTDEVKNILEKSS